MVSIKTLKWDQLFQLHIEKIENYMEVAKQDGATIAIGGKRPEREDLQAGLFFEPTVITDCDTSMRIVQKRSWTSRNC